MEDLMEQGITWIGYGEAAYHISKGLKGQGFQSMKAYDMAKDDPLRGPTIQAHGEEVGVPLCGSAAEAVEGAAFVISLTSAKVAVDVAKQVLPLMKAGQTYLDFNAASPETKRILAGLERPEGVRLCDVAVMGPVPLNGHKVPLLLAGDGGQAFVDAMTPYGMRMELLDAPVGGASAIKMIRSVFMKGFPQVLLECLLAAQEYGVTEKMLDSLDGTIGGKSVRQMADQVFTPTVIHAARRAAEMKEVVRMLDSVGLGSQMSAAADQRLTDLAALHIVDEIGSDVKLGYQEILDLISERQRQA